MKIKPHEWVLGLTLAGLGWYLVSVTPEGRPAGSAAGGPTTNAGFGAPLMP